MTIILVKIHENLFLNIEQLVGIRIDPKYKMYKYNDELYSSYPTGEIDPDDINEIKTMQVTIFFMGTLNKYGQEPPLKVENIVLVDEEAEEFYHRIFDQESTQKYITILG